MSDPVNLLLQSFNKAREEGDPSAQYCALSTLDETGSPVSRIVTVREMSAEGIVVYINALSPKVDQLNANPSYELLFFWPTLVRQFRVRGAYEIFPSAMQKRSWAEKPYAGKLYDLFQSCEQRQSSMLASRAAYLERADKLKQRFPESDTTEMPAEQLSIRFKPDYIESWVASMQDRLHDRRLYRLTDRGWQCQLLVP